MRTKSFLLYKKDGDEALFEDLVATAAEYWTAVSGVMPDWAKV